MREVMRRMAQESCKNGKPHPTKKACEEANPGCVAKRCDYCRGFHPSHKRTKGGRTRR